MKIAVIAANGRSGQAFVRAALDAGHSVRAGVLGSHTLPVHPNLVVLSCDATNEGDLKNLLKDQDAVASFIGHVKGSDANVQTAAMQKIIAVMQNLGLKRIISLTGTGVRFPGDRITLIDRVLNIAIAIIDPNRVNDGRHHVEILQQSELDWTVIRVLKLQNVPAKPFSLREHGPTKWFVSREDVAHAALQVLEQQTFIKKAPIIGKS